MNGDTIKYNLSLNDLDTDTSSVLSLENELVASARKVAEFERMLSKAIKELDLAQMEFEVITSEVVDDICKAEKISTSGRPEVRKSRAPLDKRWQIARRRLIDATSLKNDIQASVSGIHTKRFRLHELFKLKMRELGTSPEEMMYEPSHRSLSPKQELKATEGKLKFD